MNWALINHLTVIPVTYVPRSHCTKVPRRPRVYDWSKEKPEEAKS